MADLGDQLVLLHHSVMAAQEELHDVEKLRLERDRFAAAAQLTPLAVEHESVEGILHARTPRFEEIPRVSIGCLNAKPSACRYQWPGEQHC